MSRANPRFRRTNPVLPPAVANLWKVVMEGTLQDQVTLTTFYYADGGAALASTTEASIATGFQSFIMPSLLQMMAQDYSVIGFWITCMTSPTRVPKFIFPTGSPTGIVAFNSLDSILCLTIDRISAIKGQCGRGHVQLPAVPSSFVTPGKSVLNTVGNTAVTPNYTIIGTGFTVGAVTYTPQIASHGTRIAPGVLGAAPVITTRYNNILGTVRRRKIGRGI